MSEDDSDSWDDYESQFMFPGDGPGCSKATHADEHKRNPGRVGACRRLVLKPPLRRTRDLGYSPSLRRAGFPQRQPAEASPGTPPRSYRQRSGSSERNTASPARTAPSDSDTARSQREHSVTRRTSGRKPHKHETRLAGTPMCIQCAANHPRGAVRARAPRAVLPLSWVRVVWVRVCACG